jgi:hypothetical protein
MDDIDDRLPAKPWSEMSVAERKEAFTTLSQVLMDSVRVMMDDINDELAGRGCPLRVAGSLSIRWEDEGASDGKLGRE